MTREQKLEIIKRNFVRMCEACKIDTAFIALHIDDHYHGTLQYIKDQSDPCVVICKIHVAIKSFFDKGVTQPFNDSLNLN
jgi:hypothetical protein